MGTRAYLALALLAGALVLEAAPARADDLVIIANPAAATLTKQQVIDVYLARSAAFVPLDQPSGSSIYSEFYRKVTGRDAAQIKAIWSRVLFTGRGEPPRELRDSAAVKRAVAANPRAIGYISKSDVDDSVRVLPLE